MNNFDKAIIDFVTKHFDRSYNYYHTLIFVADNDNLLKGGVFAILIWYLWFRQQNKSLEKRKNIIATLVSVFFVMAINLSVAVALPFRKRPFLHPELLFTSSDVIDPYISKLSSFPSDHAALFIAICAGLFFVSLRIGIFALLYTMIVILFPRLYLGYHYPTDILAGGFIGASVTIFFNRSGMIKQFISKRILPFEARCPSFFYAVFFLISYEIADLFAGSRNILSFLYNFHRH